MLNKVKQFVKESFEQSVSGKSLKHFDRTVYWTKKLKLDVDEPILIAAYAHDISRAFRLKTTEERFKNIELNDPDILKKHQEESAHIVGDFLRKEDYDENSIKRVENMIRHHEEGGDEESDLIKHADSISYLEINAPKHIERLVKPLGKGKVRRKIEYMYNRISSPKVRSIAKPYYEKAIKQLSNRF